MRIGRTLPPAAAPVKWADLWHGLRGLCSAGSSIQAIEDQIRDEFGVSHAFLVSSGTAALTITLMALKARASSGGRSQRSNVVIPAYTCFSVPAAVVKAGLQPVLCDVDSTSFDFDHDQLERTVNDSTLCVVAHHLFGFPAAMSRLRTLCRAHGAMLVEDAAQAMGAECDGRRLGTLGDVGLFSLGRGKNITCGGGGIIVTSSGPIAKAIADCYRRLSVPSFGDQALDFIQILLMAIFVRPWLYWVPAAMPFLGLGRTTFPARIRLRRLSGLQAGLLRSWRSRLAESNRGRAETAAYFVRRLPSRFANDDPRPWLRLPIVAANSRERARLYSASQKRGLGLSLAYPAPINEIPEMRPTFAGQRFPSARTLSERLLTLPTHHWLSEKDKHAIVQLCRDLSPA
ncbi:MAG TPA: DegT/DnrJ/EryC1/StrS family aminotransferase [Vicinamibacterales bacterium]|jgi:dTDP-4-amino-4,6-dideoxygalactose transaminase